MSHESNIEFLENAALNFKEALDAEDFDTADTIIRDVKDISKDQARLMQQEYDEAWDLYEKAVRLAEDDDGRINEMRLEANE